MQGQKVLGVGKWIEATKTKATTKPKATTRKSPSQTCVSPAETAKQTAETKQNPQNGARVQTKTPTESICNWTQWLIHCITIKNIPHELGITAVQADMKALVNPSMSQAVHESRDTIKPLSESSHLGQLVAMGHHGHSNHHLICQPRSQSRDVEKSEPPFKRGETVMAKGSIVG